MSDELLQRLSELPPDDLADPSDRLQQVARRVRRRRIALSLATSAAVAAVTIPMGLYLAGHGSNEAVLKPAHQPGTSVPPEFRSACGHPGSQVTVSKTPVTVNHADCNLTGVFITIAGTNGGAYVARVPGTTGNSESGLRITVASSGDVTVDDSH